MMLRKFSVLSITSIFLFGLGGIAAAETVEEVLNGYYETRGGLEKIQAVNSLRMTGKMSMMGGMEAPLKIEQIRPNLHRSEFVFQGMTGIQVFDGKTGWMIMPFMGSPDPQPMPEDQAEQMEEQSDIDGALVDWEKKGYAIEYQGKDEAEGAECFKLKVTKDENVDFYYLEVESFLPIKIVGTRKMNEQEFTAEIIMSEYKEVESEDDSVNGLIFPFSMETRMGESGFSQTLSLETIELNVEIDKAQFAMPKKEEAPKADEDTGAEKPEEDSKE